MVQLNVALQNLEVELQNGRSEQALVLAHQILDLEGPGQGLNRAQRASLALKPALEVPVAKLEANLDLVRLLLENGASPSPRYQGDFSPLAQAIEAKSATAANLLLDFGADAQEMTRGRAFLPRPESVLVRAIEAELSDVALRLLDLGADAQGEPNWSSPLYAAAKVGDEAVALALLERGADLDGLSASTALMGAAEKDGNPVLELLLKRVTASEVADQHKATTLHIAAYINAPTNIGRLLKAGAQTWRLDTAGKTALEVAAANSWRQDSSEAVTLLLEAGAKRSVLDAAILTAIERGNDKVVPLLIAAGAEFKKPGGGSPYVLLSGNGNLGALRHRSPDEEAEKQAKVDDLAVAQLLWNAGARPMPSEVTEALKLAAAAGHTELVKWLGAIGGEKVGANSESPLHIAAANGQREAVKELLTQGEIAGLQREAGNCTPLMLLASNGAVKRFWESPFQFLNRRDIQADQWVEENDAAIAEMLLSADANLEAQTPAGFTALHLAAVNSAPRVVELLIENGANVQHQTSWGRTALHGVVTAGRASKVREYGKSGNLSFYTDTLEFGFGSLPQLAEAWEERIVGILLSTSIDINARERNGWAALHFAVVLATPRTVARLLEAGADPDMPFSGNRRPREAVLYYGRTQTLLKREGFSLADFPAIRADLEAASQVSPVVLPPYLANAKPELQIATQYDSEILHLLGT